MQLELSNILLGVMTLSMTIITVILGCAIPWGYTIGSRLTKIETKIAGALSLQKELTDLRDRVTILETEDRLKHLRK